MATSNLSQLPFYKYSGNSNICIKDQELETSGNNNDQLESIDPDINFYSDNSQCKYYTSSSFNKNKGINEHKLSLFHMNIVHLKTVNYMYIFQREKVVM